jgi:hypothetical protein
MRILRICAFLVLAAASLALLAGCPQKTASTTASQTAASAKPAAPAAPAQQALPPPEQPVPPEKNPPGDIPDTQVFIKYASAAGKYELEVPEGWARTENGTDVEFVDKLDGISVALTQSAAAPTVESVQQEQVPVLQQQGRAVEVQEVKEKAMPVGAKAVYVVYTSNSAPDPVTNKQVRLDNVTYYFYRDGMLAALTLWAPSGADNVDQWKLISESFRWM